MLSSILRSKRAVAINIEIMRALSGSWPIPVNDLN
jgi:hypothetical protein